MEIKMANTLPPDLDEMNEYCAECAAAALLIFQNLTNSDREDAVSDLLADLMHWCDRHGRNFDNELRRALYHYEEETSD
jgi:hypothetical protein